MRSAILILVIVLGACSKKEAAPKPEAGKDAAAAVVAKAAPDAAPPPPVVPDAAPPLDLAVWWKDLPPCVKSAILEQQQGKEPLDAAGLGHMAEVEIIQLDYHCDTPITDLAWVAPLSKLSRVLFEGQPIADLSPLSATPTLTDLELLGCKVPGWPANLTLPALTTLRLESGSFTSVAGLERQTALTKLELYGTPITDIGPLASLSSLETLTLSGTHVQNLDAVRGMTHLAKLSMADNLDEQTIDLEPVGALPLSEVWITHAKLTGVEHLAKNTTLEIVSFSYTDLASLDALQASTITDLAIIKTQVPDDAVAAWKKAHPKATVTTAEDY